MGKRTTKFNMQEQKRLALWAADCASIVKERARQRCHFPKRLRSVLLLPLIILCFHPVSSLAQAGDTLVEGSLHATITATNTGDLRSYELSTNAELRKNQPPDKRITFSETPDHARIRTGNLIFDGLYALAVSEALQNSVSQIKDKGYGHGEPIPLEAFQTGEHWTYVWTRDLAYSTHLALAGFDPDRAVRSLLFKSSSLKPSAIRN